MSKVMHESARRLLEAAKIARPSIETAADLARALNQSEQTITNWSKRKTGVSKEGRLLAQKELGISATWIEDGSGKMFPDAHHNSVPADMPSKEASGDYIAGSVAGPEPTIGEKKPAAYGNFERAPVGYREIPVISYVQAGMMTEAIDPFSLGDGLETITTDLELSEVAFGLIIKGLSMEPEFKEGDKVIIEPAISPQPGDFVVAKNTEEEATFKKYRPRGTSESGNMIFELVPLNDDFATLHSERDHLHIIGVMVEHRKYRRR